MAFKIFTVENGKVTLGATPKNYTLTCGIKIPAIIVGEVGRGRKLGILPVQVPFLEDGYKPVLFAEIGSTQSGRPKLIPSNGDNVDQNKAIVVLLTTMGYRGESDHTGDRLHRWRCYSGDHQGEGDPPEECPFCDSGVILNHTRPLYAKWPGEDLVVGMVADGQAGRVGRSEQKVSLIPRGVVFRTAYGGRLYGASPEHYYVFDGEKILVGTLEERKMLDLF